MDRVVRLLDDGSDANAGDAALMFAALGGYSLIVRMLLARGAEPLLRAGNGWTALRFAESRHQREVATLLRRAEEKMYRDVMARLRAELDGLAG